MMVSLAGFRPVVDSRCHAERGPRIGHLAVPVRYTALAFDLLPRREERKRALDERSYEKGFEDGQDLGLPEVKSYVALSQGPAADGAVLRPAR